MNLSALKIPGGPECGFAIKITFSCDELAAAGVSVPEFKQLMGDMKKPLSAPRKIALLAEWAQLIETATDVDNLPPGMTPDAYLAISAGLCPDCSALSDCHGEGCPQDAEGVV
ncbi:MAG: hypothetical protein V3W14_07320 [Candidatus Neomarinimicrobiota bacterium]